MASSKRPKKLPLPYVPRRPHATLLYQLVKEQVQDDADDTKADAARPAACPPLRDEAATLFGFNLHASIRIPADDDVGRDIDAAALAEGISGAVDHPSNVLSAKHLALGFRLALLHERHHTRNFCANRAWLAVWSVESIQSRVSVRRRNWAAPRGEEPKLTCWIVGR